MSKTQRMAITRDIELDAGGQPVPGVIWMPADDGSPGPTVLMGHGRCGSRHDPYLEELAVEWVSRHGWTVVALDAPFHGDRDQRSDVSATPRKPEARQVRAEWQAAIDHVVAAKLADPGRLGYWGLSMGAAFGIPLLAAETRVSCAVLGLMHTRYYEDLVSDAQNVQCPVMFSLHWDDQRVPRSEGLDLFDAIGSTDKRLHVYPGDHGAFLPEEIHSGERFLASHF